MSHNIGRQEEDKTMMIVNPNSFRVTSTVLRLRQRLASPISYSYSAAASTRRWMSSNSSSSTIIRVAIVGSGPSGCYTAKYLQSCSTPDNKLSIDILERLPTPFGLVRSGVAPDHPEVKNAQNDFSQLFDDNNNKNNGQHISFYGNVTVGKDVALHELRQLYDIVVLAYGCESDRKLGITGEDTVSGVLSAREFVAWYNGHPEFNHIGAIVSKALGDKPEEADVVVIGHGNVALDCARVLAKGSPGLVDTDISANALPVLGGGVKSTTVVGRRGHVQGAFTIKELRELIKLDEEGYKTSFLVSQDELNLGATESSLKELEAPNGRPRKRIDKLLRRDAATTPNANNPKQVALRFLMNPVSFVANEQDPSTLGAVICERTKLEGEAGQQVCVGTGELESIPAQLALVSVGYKGVAVPGLEDELFDSKRGIVVNTHGKVMNASNGLGGLYVSGWLKRGPSGIIGTNIADAKDTVASIVKDLENHVPKKEGSSTTLLSDLLKERQVRVVDWKAYQRIDAVETNPERKRSASQPREKIPTHEELLEAAFGSDS